MLALEVLAGLEVLASAHILDVVGVEADTAVMAVTLKHTQAIIPEAVAEVATAVTAVTH